MLVLRGHCGASGVAASEGAKTSVQCGKLCMCIYLKLLRSAQRTSLLAGVTLSSAAVEVDSGLPRASGSSAALGGISDRAAAGGALLGCEGVENAAGTGLNLGAVEHGMRKLLGIVDSVA